VIDPSVPLDLIPTIPRRYFSSGIDFLLILGVFIVPAMVLPDNDFWRMPRIAAGFAMVFLYEPIGTGCYATLGQRIAGVRVRDFKTGQPIGLPRALARIVVKGFLGIRSVAMMRSSSGRRGLHDLAVDSIVILAKSENDYARWARER